MEERHDLLLCHIGLIVPCQTIITMDIMYTKCSLFESAHKFFCLNLNKKGLFYVKILLGTTNIWNGVHADSIYNTFKAPEMSLRSTTKTSCRPTFSSLYQKAKGVSVILS